MGSCTSKHKQPKSEQNKYIPMEQVVVSDGFSRKTSSVTVTQNVNVIQTVTSKRTSVNSVTSQTTRSTETTTASPAVMRPSQTYTSVYTRPSLSTLIDASPVNGLTNTRRLVNEFSRPQSANTPGIYVNQTHDTVYDLDKEAYVLVFHHYIFKDSSYNRQGSSRDMQKIREILNNYRCSRLDINENYTARGVRQKMNNISTQSFAKHSCLIVFIMSHGEINDKIIGFDGSAYSFHEDIVEHCTSNQTLKGKPKIFVVQACRGNNAMETDSSRITVSDKSDIVAFQSSYHGTVSYRDKEEGSSFMQAFLRLLHTNNQQSIINVNTLLNREFKSKRLGQAPTLTSTLQKELIFGKLLKTP